jgi:hypothetical protein
MDWWADRDHIERLEGRAEPLLGVADLLAVRS